MAVNTAKILEKWKRNSGQSVQAYQDGVSAVTVAPTQQAAAAVDKYARGVQEAVASGRFVNNLQAVSLQDWQQASKDKGSRNFANGIASVSPRAAKAMADQQQYADTVKQAVANMPNNTEADADARMLAAVNLMRQYKKAR